MLFAGWPGQKGKQSDSPILDAIGVVSKYDSRQPLMYGDAQGKEAERLYLAFEKKYLSAGASPAVERTKSARGKLDRRFC